jgi:hypothetical protein
MIEIHRENWLKVPEMSAMGVVDRLYPYQLFLPAEGQAAVQGILRTFNLVDAAKQASKARNFGIRKDVRYSRSTSRTTGELNLRDYHNRIQADF